MIEEKDAELLLIFPERLHITIYTAESFDLSCYFCDECGALIWEELLHKHRAFHRRLEP